MPRTAILACALVALAVGWLAYRAARLMNVPGAPDPARWVMQDFRDAIYFPVRAVLDGGNPYDVRAYLRTYPVGQAFPPYSPLLLLLHAPLAPLPLATAQVTYLVGNVFLTFGLAYAVLRLTGGASMTQTMLLGAVVLLSRPGQFNVLLGQPTLLLVAGVYLALFWPRRSPAWAAVGLALTSMKPTYAVPLALLMLARSEWRSVLIGGGLAVVGAALGAVGPLVAAGGPGAFAALLPANYAAFAAESAADPGISLHRVDAGVIVSRLIGRPPGTLLDIVLFVSIVGIGALALRRAARDDVALSAGVACSTILACVYHSSYNLVLLMLPAVALLRATPDPAWLRTSRLRALLWLAYCGLAMNYLASENAVRLLGFGGALRTLVGSLNSVGVLVLFVTYCSLTLRRGAAARDLLPAPAHALGGHA
jgi:Glycosyltransferase family 87